MSVHQTFDTVHNNDQLTLKYLTQPYAVRRANEVTNESIYILLLTMLSRSVSTYVLY